MDDKSFDKCRETTPGRLCWLCRKRILSCRDVECLFTDLSDPQNADTSTTAVTLTAGIWGSTATWQSLQLKAIIIKKKKLEGISLQWVQVSRLWQVVCFREDAMLFQAELCKHFLPSQNVFPRAGTLCLLKSLASVQKSILLENSHMQKWTCRIWSYKSNQSEKHRSCTTMEMRDRYYTGGGKPVRKG